ncbi:MAG: hypothetical protein WC415_05970 [Patescibacteria group bacterium]|jgi:hypothetical protein
MATKKLNAVIGIGAEQNGSFRTTMGGIDKALGSTAGRVRALDAAAGNIAGYRKLQEALPKSAQKVEAAEAKLAAMRAELAATGGASVALKNKIGEQEARVNGLRAAYDRNENQLRSTRDALKGAGVDVKRLADEEKRLAAEAARTTAILKAQTAVKVQMGNLRRSFGEVKSAAMAAGISFAAAGYALNRVVGGAARAGDEAAKTAASLNMSASALQQWQFIGMRQGVTADSMTKAFEKLNEQIDDAALNGGKARETLGELNLDPDSLRAASATERMQTISVALQNYRGRMSKAAIVQDLFGKGALRMQGVLKLSTEEQAELAREAVRSGYAQTAAQAKAAEAYQDSLTSLQASIEGVRNSFAQKLFPAFSAGMDWLTRNTWALKAAFAAVALILATACVVSVVKLGSASVSAFRDVRKLLLAMRVLGATEAAGGKAGIFSKMLGGAKSVMPWLTKIGTAVIPMIVGAATTGATAIGAAIAAIPIVGWIAAAITVIAFLVWKYWTPIKKFFVGLGQSIAHAFTWAFGIGAKAVRGFVGIFRGYVAILQKIGKTIIDIMLAPFRAIRSAIEWVQGKLGLSGGETANVAKSAASPAAAQGRRTTAAPMAATRMTAISPAAAQGRRGATVNSQQTNNFTINTQPGQSPEQFATATVRALDARERERTRRAMVDYSPAMAGGMA